MTFSEILLQVGRSLRPWVSVAPWEQGVRVRLGKNVKELAPGFHFIFPVFDRVVVQPVASRTTNVYAQTLVTRDGKTVMLRAVVRWKVESLAALCASCACPEDLMQDVFAAAIAEAVPDLDASELSRFPPLGKMDQLPGGVIVESFKLTDLAIAQRTYRLLRQEMTEGIWGTRLKLTTQ